MARGQRPSLIDKVRLRKGDETPPEDDQNPPSTMEQEQPDTAAKELARLRQALAESEGKLERLKAAPQKTDDGPLEPMPEPTVLDPTEDVGEIPVGRQNAVHTQIGSVRTKRGLVKIMEMKWRHPRSDNVHASRYSE